MSYDQTNRGDCYFCGCDGTEFLESHHIIPKRMDGPDHPDNLVDLCPKCHRKIEQLYDDFVWRKVSNPYCQLSVTHRRICPNCDRTLVLDDGFCIYCDNYVHMELVDWVSIMDEDEVVGDD